MLVPVVDESLRSASRTLPEPALEETRDVWEALTPRGEWRTISSHTDRASEVLGRIQHTHDAALGQPFGPKRYQRDTSSDEDEPPHADDDGVGARDSLMVVMSEDPRTPESLVKLSRSSSANILRPPAHFPAAAPVPSEEEMRAAEREDLEELERENERLRESIATALREERERTARRSDKAAFRRMERIYASAELEPEHQLPAATTAVHTALAHAGEMGVRLKAAGARVGHVTCSLMWSNTDNLDLHCESETGGHISHNNRKGKCGGRLDVVHTSDLIQERPVENIVWDTAPPAGKYRIWVENNTARNDGPTPFVVRLTMDGTSQDKEFHDVREMESVDVFIFERGQLDSSQCTEAESQEPQSSHDPAHLLLMLKERERVIQEQKEEIQKLRQQLAIQQQGGSPPVARMAGALGGTVAAGKTSEYSANIRGMSSAYESGVAPGGSLSELQESGGTFAVKPPTSEK